MKAEVDYFSIACDITNAYVDRIRGRDCAHAGAIVERCDMHLVVRRSCADCGADLVEACPYCDMDSGHAVWCERCRGTFCALCIKRGMLCAECYEAEHGV